MKKQHEKNPNLICGKRTEGLPLQISPTTRQSASAPNHEKKAQNSRHHERIQSIPVGKRQFVGELCQNRVQELIWNRHRGSIRTLKAFSLQLGQSREGSAEALGELLGQYRKLLLWTANQAMNSDLRTKVAASDVVQETLLEAFRDFQHFRGDSDQEWQAWLRQVLSNNVANLERRYRRASKRSIELERSIEAESGVRREAEMGIQRDLQPENSAIQKEQTESLSVALMCLQEDYRQVLVYRYQDQLAFGEIALRMNRSENAVRKLWARAVQTLQESMGQPQ